MVFNGNIAVIVSCSSSLLQNSIHFRLAATCRLVFVVLDNECKTDATVRESRCVARSMVLAASCHKLYGASNNKIYREQDVFNLWIAIKFVAWFNEYGIVEMTILGLRH